MKPNRIFPVLIALSSILTVATVFSGVQTTNSLEYRFVEGSTNAYRVTIESPSENNPMRCEGVILVAVRSVDKDGGTVFFRGRLQAKQGGGGRIRVGPVPPFGARGPFGPNLPLMDGRMFAPLMPYNEAQIDRRGRVLRVAGLPDLPKPLGSYATLFFEALRFEGTNGWQSESVVTVEEGFSGSSRVGGFNPGPPGGLGNLTGNRKEEVHLAAAAGDMVRLEKQVGFRSWMATGDEPRLSFSSKSEIVFDPTAGAIRSIKVEGATVMATFDFVQRMPLVLQAERLEGDELAKALAEGGYTGPAALTETEVDKLLTQLKSDDRPQQMEAAQRLLSADVDSYASKLLPAVLPFALDAENGPLGMLAARVLTKAATHEQVPLLLRMLKQQDFGQQYQAIEALRRLNDNRSIAPLADLIARGANGAHQAAQALAEFGPVAEGAALGLLKEKHAETRRLACQILQKCGGAKSIDALQAVIAEGDPNLMQNAGEALRGIRLRAEQADKTLY